MRLVLSGLTANFDKKDRELFYIIMPADFYERITNYEHFCKQS